MKVIFESFLFTKPAVFLFSALVFALYIILYRKGKISAPPGRLSCARTIMDAGAGYVFLMIFVSTQGAGYKFSDLVTIKNGIADQHLEIAIFIALLETTFGLLAVLELYKPPE